MLVYLFAARFVRSPVHVLLIYFYYKLLLEESPLLVPNAR